ncbi:MAG: sugar O-acetyltransferase [Anaerolineales bacterium]|jgi:maltose O-acetyltransferase
MPSKTEKEKMLAGERYNGLDPDLQAELKKVKRLIRVYNLSETGPKRDSLLRQLVGHIGQNSTIEPPFYCSYGRNIYIGDYVYLNFLCTIFDNNQVHIGNHVMIGPAVQIYTVAHSLQAEDRNQGSETASPITIEDNVWIGGSAIILPGVIVGRNAVVGAGAVVTRDIPPNTVAAGNPARVIREIEQE